jgi:hypothetical protein
MLVVQHRCSGAYWCRHSFLKGPGFNPSPLAFPAAAALHFFLKVLPVTRHFKVRGACGTTSQHADVAGLLLFVDLPLLAFLSLFFFWA